MSTQENPVESLGTLTAAVYAWADAYGQEAPYVVVDMPGNPGVHMWNGHRWIDIDIPLSMIAVSPWSGCDPQCVGRDDCVIATTCRAARVNGEAGNE